MKLSYNSLGGDETEWNTNGIGGNPAFRSIRAIWIVRCWTLSLALLALDKANRF